AKKGTDVEGTLAGPGPHPPRIGRAAHSDEAICRTEAVLSRMSNREEPAQRHHGQRAGSDRVEPSEPVRSAPGAGTRPPVSLLPGILRPKPGGPNWLAAPPMRIPSCLGSARSAPADQPRRDVSAPPLGAPEADPAQDEQPQPQEDHRGRLRNDRDRAEDA